MKNDHLLVSPGETQQEILKSYKGPRGFLLFSTHLILLLVDRDFMEKRKEWSKMGMLGGIDALKGDVAMSMAIKRLPAVLHY